MAFYVIDDNKNKAESYSKEQFLAVLQQAIDDGDLESIDADSAFVSKIKSIVDGATYKIGFCTQAQYNALETLGQIEANAYYIILDDDSYDVLDAAVSALQSTVATHTTQIGSLESRINTVEITLNTSIGPDVASLNTDVYRIKTAQVTGSFSWNFANGTGADELWQILDIDPCAQFYILEDLHSGTVGTPKCTLQVLVGRNQIESGGTDDLALYCMRTGSGSGGVTPFVSEIKTGTIYYRYFKSFTANS